MAAVVEPEPRAVEQHKLWEEVYSKERICNRVATLPLDEPVHGDKVRFVAISDTHNRLDELLPRIPPGDVLLHCGDFTNFGDADELDKFNREMGQLPHKYKIVIAGNHELGFDDSEDVSGRQADEQMWNLGSCHRGTPRGYKLLTNCTYLHDSSITVYGLNIYGSSWHPLPGFSFYRPRGEPILQEWLKIPAAETTPNGQLNPVVDVLLTHTPPIGHSDIFETGERWGDVDLLNCVEKRIRPKVHVFGHVHEQPWATTNGETLFINAAICNHGKHNGEVWSHFPKNGPLIFDLPLPAGVNKK